MESTFFWFDYETFGTDPALDRPSQFAGLRTNTELEPVGEPLTIYNKLTDDYLPDPVACKITGIGPKTVAQHGTNEAEFIATIHEELATPGTCNVGYNNIRFDDEFTRFTLFRNFFDAYEHEWKNNNSRWDMLDIVRLTRALRPDGIEWPHHEDGSASNRLEDLTKANGLEHSQAHDAMSDVYATIDVARMIRDRNPKLFGYMLANKSKDKCRDLLDINNAQPVIHVSGKIPSKFHHLALVLPVARHPVNANGIIVLNLHVDPAELIELAQTGDKGVEDIANRMFTRNEDLPEGTSRLPLKTIHVNKTPVVAPLTVMRDEDAERLQIDLEACHKHRHVIESLPAPQRHQLEEAVSKAMTLHQFQAPENVDATLYSGAFFTNKDKDLFATIRKTNPNELAKFADRFDDSRVNDMLARYQARNFPDSLSDSELEKWLAHCHAQLTGDDNGHRASFPRTLESFRASLKQADWESGDTALTRLRDELLEYANHVEKVTAGKVTAG